MTLLAGPCTAQQLKQALLLDGFIRAAPTAAVAKYIRNSHEAPRS